MMNKIKNFCAYTLIELVIFLVIIGIVVSGVVTAYTIVLKGSNTAITSTISTELAKQRMELIIGNKKTQGFSSFIDPCSGGSPPTECTLPSGYTAVVTIANWLSNANLKIITVVITKSATGPGATSDTLVTVVGNY